LIQVAKKVVAEPSPHAHARRAVVERRAVENGWHALAVELVTVWNDVFLVKPVFTDSESISAI
jgi:hypothetical protein